LIVPDGPIGRLIVHHPKRETGTQLVIDSSCVPVSVPRPRFLLRKKVGVIWPISAWVDSLTCVQAGGQVALLAIGRGRRPGDGFLSFFPRFPPGREGDSHEMGA